MNRFKIRETIPDIALVKCWFSIFCVSVFVSSCADKPAPIDNAYCRLYIRLPDPSDAVHMKKRENKLAVLTNEQTWLHECGHSGTLKKGPI